MHSRGTTRTSAARLLCCLSFFGASAQAHTSAACTAACLTATTTKGLRFGSASKPTAAQAATPAHAAANAAISQLSHPLPSPGPSSSCPPPPPPFPQPCSTRCVCQCNRDRRVRRTSGGDQRRVRPSACRFQHVPVASCWVQQTGRPQRHHGVVGGQGVAGQACVAKGLRCGVGCGGVQP